MCQMLINRKINVNKWYCSCYLINELQPALHYNDRQAINYEEVKLNFQQNCKKKVKFEQVGLQNQLFHLLIRAINKFTIVLISARLVFHQKATINIQQPIKLNNNNKLKNRTFFITRKMKCCLNLQFREKEINFLCCNISITLSRIKLYNYFF